MTEVLTISSQTDGGFGSSSLRRSSSQTSFLQQGSYPRSTPNLRSAVYPQGCYETRTPASVPSSAPSSPRLQQPDFSNQPSYTSTPSSSLSLDEDCDFDDSDILFPSYNDGLPVEACGNLDPPPSPELAPQEDPTNDKLHTSLSNLDLYDHAKVSGDDTAIACPPSRHVDYLSHDWIEEDIWSSWRHITSKRSEYSNYPRLENASWRTWAKLKNRLKTISPETLNWMKDHDVTWLYGPLQTRDSFPFNSNCTPRIKLSRSNSFAHTKPILKKRSLSELMLQRSISSSTLMKQAVDALHAQQLPQQIRVRPVLGVRTCSDFVTSSPRTSGDQVIANTPSVMTSSSSSSGLMTPSDGRHIHFNNKVEQCIAINKDGDDHEDDHSAIQDDDDSSDDGIIMMKPVHGKERKLSNRNTPRGSFSGEGKTIAMLPSTTLKYRGDTPEPPEPSPSQRGSGFWSAAAKLVSSPSQETLRPSKPSSSNFLLDDEDEDADMNWQPPMSPGSRRDSIYSHQARLNTCATEEEEEDMEGRGLRRTPSGMFMPYEEDEDDIVAASLFGKVIDTVNTAKDIAHVIWNVGWRR